MSLQKVHPAQAFEPSKKELRQCPTHGEYESWRFGGDCWTICDKCSADAESKSKADEQCAKDQKRMDDAGIPLRFRGSNFENYIARSAGQKFAVMMTRSYCENFLEHRTDGRCLMLTGLVGTGKTHLAIAVAKFIMAQKFTVRYVTVLDMIEAIRETWRADSQWSEGDVLRRYASCDLLILDEVGVQYGKESEQVELFKVLNKRYNDVRPSILISNVSPDQLKGYIGDRAYDRLRENDGKSVVFDWESERGK